MKNSTNRNSSNDVSNASVAGDTNDTSNMNDATSISTECIIDNANGASSSIAADANSTTPEGAHITKPQPSYNPIYYSAQKVWEAFGSHLTGMLSAPVCVVSEKTLNDAAQNALFASVKQLGFGERAITFVTLTDAPTNSTQSFQEDSLATPRTLSSEQMFAIIEGIDPQVVIATDASSMSVLSHAYSVEFTENIRSAPARLLGRNAIGFVNFEKMLLCQKDKRAAWEHIKKLGTAPKAH